jgi:type IV pilus assembly protein PilZ
MSDERRNLDRAPITLEVQYRRLNTFFADYTRNISKGGTFIRTQKPLAVGTEFVFVLVLPRPAGSEAPGGEQAGDVTTRVELSGVVRWVVATEDATEDKPAGMGIRFVFADDAERESVEALVTGLMNDSLGPALAGKLLGGR